MLVLFPDRDIGPLPPGPHRPATQHAAFTRPYRSSCRLSTPRTCGDHWNSTTGPGPPATHPGPEYFCISDAPWLGAGARDPWRGACQIEQPRNPQGSGDRPMSVRCIRARQITPAECGLVEALPEGARRRTGAAHGPGSASTFQSVFLKKSTGYRSQAAACPWVCRDPRLLPRSVRPAKECPRAPSARPVRARGRGSPHWDRTQGRPDRGWISRDGRSSPGRAGSLDICSADDYLLES